MQFSVDVKGLKDVIDQSGIPMTKIAEKAGMKRGTLYNRLSGIGEFTASEIGGLAQALRLSSDERDAIFFALKV